MKLAILGPIITEKSMIGTADGKYTFRVNPKSNKPEIADFIAKFYHVKVESVRIIKIKGKTKNFRGKASGKTQSFKKAIVKLEKGQKIKDFEVKE